MSPPCGRRGQVVGLVGRALAGGAVGGLEECPAQRRQALAREAAGGPLGVRRLQMRARAQWRAASS
jgi:hypothetical protein